MKKAVIYARYSSNKQTEQSIEGQISVCKDYAKNNDMQIVGLYIDRALTGKNDHRPEFQKMIADSVNKNFDCVLVYKLDRFARNRLDSAINKNKLKQNGVKLISASENITDTPEGIILESVIEGVNEYYSAELAQKVKRGIAESIKKRVFLGGAVTFGYNLVDKKLVINNKEAKIVKHIFNLYVQGKTSYQIMHDLKDSGTKNKIGKNFTVNAILKILKNKRYIGVYSYNGVDYPNYMPAIIEKGKFEMVQKKLNEHKKPNKDNNENFLLSGKLLCGQCGKMMFGESGNNRFGNKYCYYKCSGKKRCQTNCKNDIYRKKELEDAVINATKKYLDKETIKELSKRVADLAKENDHYKKLAELKNQKNSIDKKIRNILNAIEEGFYNSAMKIEMQELENQKKYLEQKIVEESLVRPIEIEPEQMEIWFSQFLDCEPNKKTSELLINSLVNKVIVQHNNMTIVYNSSKDNERISKLSENCICSDKNCVVVRHKLYPNTKFIVYHSFIILKTTIQN